MREAGEFKRFGGGGMTLAAGRAQVWDGRFELIAGRSGLTVQPLQGFAARLAPAQKTELGQIARGGRGALPAVQGDGLPPFCPLLGASSDAVRAKDLAPARFFAACGLVRQERESSCAQLMADSLQPSYVSFRAKGLSE
jgi:tRNA(Ile)-lysidine synthase